MMRLLAAYGTTLVVLGIVDVAYLGTIGAKLFRDTLGDVMAPTISVPPAVIFYLLYPVAIVIFAITPALETGRWTTALTYGALFGFAAYMTYDLTNLATIRNWTVGLAVADLAWGTFVTAVSATAGFLVARMVAPG